MSSGATFSHEHATGAFDPINLESVSTAEVGMRDAFACRRDCEYVRCACEEGKGGGRDQFQKDDGMCRSSLNPTSLLSLTYLPHPSFLNPQPPSFLTYPTPSDVLLHTTIPPPRSLYPHLPNLQMENIMTGLPFNDRLSALTVVCKGWLGVRSLPLIHSRYPFSSPTIDA